MGLDEELKSSYRTEKKREPAQPELHPAELWTMLLHASRNLSPAEPSRIGYQQKKKWPTSAHEYLCWRDSCADFVLLNAAPSGRGTTALELHFTRATRQARKGKRVVHVLALHRLESNFSKSCVRT